MNQQTKTFIATIGPATTADAMTPAEFDSLLYQKYLSQGYRLEASHYTGEARGSDNRVEGYRILVMLTREYEEKKPEKTVEPNKELVKTEEVITPK